MADLDDIKEGKDFGIDRPQQNTLYTPERLWFTGLGHAVTAGAHL